MSSGKLYAASYGLEIPSSDTRRLSGAKFMSKVVPALKRITKVLLIVALPVAVMALFGVRPSFAADAAKPSIFKSKTGSIIQKLLLGANAKGSISGKAGDTRAELSSIINFLSMFFIMGAWVAMAWVFGKKEEADQMTRLKKEVNKETKYRETMYFEAVEKIMKRLEDPKLKGSMKATLIRQMKELDPKGEIRKFLDGKGPRPDLSEFIQDSLKQKRDKVALNKEKLAKKGTKGGKKDKKEPKIAKEKEETVSAKEDDDDNVRDDDDVDGDFEGPSSPEVAPPKSNKSEAIYLKVLRELDSSLKGSIEAEKRVELVAYLKARIESIKDGDKQEKVINNIAKKLGDDDYWIDYAAKM